MRDLQERHNSRQAVGADRQRKLFKAYNGNGEANKLNALKNSTLESATSVSTPVAYNL